MFDDDLSRLSPAARRLLLAQLLGAAPSPQPARSPLSHQQRGLLVAQRFAPGSVAYNVAFGARAPSDCRVTDLRAALELVVRRHRSLCAVYSRDDGHLPAWSVREPQPLDIRRTGECTWRREELLHHVSQAAREPFDLSSGPLVRVEVVTTREGRYLVLFAHQLAADFWSLGVVLEELDRLYAASRSGKAVRQPPAEVQYEDYVRWQDALLRSPEGDRLWSYWQRTLAGELPVLDLHGDRPRSSVRPRRSGRHRFMLGPGLTRGIRLLAATERTTAFSVVLAAVSALLHRHGGQEQLLLGSFAAGRGQPEFDDLVGCLANPVVLTVDVSGAPTFRELLQRSSRNVVEALEHQDYPFDLLVQRLRPPRDGGRTPFFQVAVDWLQLTRPLGRAATQPLAPAAAAPSQPMFVPVFAHHAGSPCDLLLQFTETAETVEGTLVYDGDLFTPARTARMSGQLRRLLAAALDDPDQAVMDLPLLSEAERRRAVDDWASTGRSPADTCLHSLVEAQARGRPDAIAVVDGRDRISYAELEQRATDLALRLRAHGVRRMPVGICAERSADMVVWLLAILKAGAAFVPLDPAHPSALHRRIIRDSGTRVVVAPTHLRHRFGGVGVEVLCPGAGTVGATERAKMQAPPTVPAPGQAVSPPVDVDWDDAGSPPTVPAPGEAVSPRDLAYVMYTSGSTGEPKGVAVEHRSVSALLRWTRDFFGPAQLAGVLAATPLGFDLSVFEVFAPLSAGGSVIVARSVLDARRLPAADQITLVNTVPSVARAMMRTGGLPASVKTVNLAGEAADHDLVRRLYSEPSVEQVYNLYAPTETTVYSTCALLRPARPLPRNLGRPIAGARVYVLDTMLRPAPVGVLGEVFIGGAGVARGYMNDPQRTRASFVPDPYSPEPDARMFRTGDLGSYQPDGTIELAGRRDRQVKVNGCRVELAEVEAALLRHPEVVDAAVTAGPESRGPSRRLVAHVVCDAATRPDADGTTRPDAAELRRFLRTMLPAFALPSVFHFLASMPRTHGGKVDVRKLEATPAAGVEPRAAGPVTPPPLEALLARIWAETLQVDHVGPHDDFFELGGSSIHSLEVSARAGACGIPLAPELVFACPTITELAAAVAVSNPAGRAR